MVNNVAIKEQNYNKEINEKQTKMLDCYSLHTPNHLNQIVSIVSNIKKDNDDNVKKIDTDCIMNVLFEGSITIESSDEEPITEFEAINKAIEEKSDVNKIQLKHDNNNKEEFKEQCNYLIQSDCSQESQESYINDNSESQQDPTVYDRNQKLVVEIDEPIKENKDISIILKLNKKQIINLNLFLSFDETIEMFREAFPDENANNLIPQESCGLSTNNCQSTSLKENYIDKDPNLSADKTLDPFNELEMDEFLRVSNSFSEFQPLEESYDEMSNLEKDPTTLDKESEKLLHSKMRALNEKLLPIREFKSDNNSFRQACTSKSDFNKKSKDRNRSRYKRAQINHITRSKALQNNFISKKPRVVETSRKIENFNVSSKELNDECIGPEESKSLEISNNKTEGFSLKKLYSEGSVWIATEESESECSLGSHNMRQNRSSEINSLTTNPRKQRKQKVTLVNKVYERDLFAENTDTS
ncbi:17487_t:CDS:2, partial [Racocetra fulgida]